MKEIALEPILAQTITLEIKVADVYFSYTTIRNYMIVTFSHDRDQPAIGWGRTSVSVNKYSKKKDCWRRRNSVISHSILVFSALLSFDKHAKTKSTTTKKYYPSSSKINQGVPLNSLLLSFHVPRNSAPCSLDHQKYSSPFPTIPLISYFFMVSYFHRFTPLVTVQILLGKTPLSPSWWPKNERNCNTLPIFCRRNGLFPSYT